MTDTSGVGGATPPSGATPDPAPPAGATPQADGGDLGDAGKRALAEVRKELRARDAAVAERDARIAELENAGRSELERKTSDVDRLTATVGERDGRIAELEARVAEYELNELRRDVAVKAGIPEWWQRLQGSDEATLTADAASLVDRIGGGRGTPDLGAGARGTAPGMGMDQLIRRRAGR